MSAVGWLEAGATGAVGGLKGFGEAAGTDGGGGGFGEATEAAAGFAGGLGQEVLGDATGFVGC